MRPRCARGDALDVRMSRCRYPARARGVPHGLTRVRHATLRTHLPPRPHPLVAARVVEWPSSSASWQSCSLSAMPPPCHTTRGRSMMSFDRTLTRASSTCAASIATVPKAKVPRDVARWAHGAAVVGHGASVDHTVRNRRLRLASTEGLVPQVPLVHETVRLAEHHGATSRRSRHVPRLRQSSGRRSRCLGRFIARVLPSRMLGSDKPLPEIHDPVPSRGPRRQPQLNSHPGALTRDLEHGSQTALCGFAAVGQPDRVDDADDKLYMCLFCGEAIEPTETDPCSGVFTTAWSRGRFREGDRAVLVPRAVPPPARAPEGPALLPRLRRRFLTGIVLLVYNGE